MKANNNYLTQEEKDKILELHEIGMNTVQIAKCLNRHNSSIGRYLKKCGIENNGTNSKLTKSDIEDIKEYYQKGLTSKQIFELYNNKVGCEETIQVIIRKNGISRPRGYQNNFKHDYFKQINTSSKAYFLGFLLTDGNVHTYNTLKRQDKIQIGLKYEDKYILDILKNELNSDNKISEYHKNNRDECYFSVASNEMAKDLSQYGIVPNKTFLINKLPSIPKEFIPDLIRGIFDGDGTVFILNSNKKLRFGFYGTHNLIKEILEFLNKNLNISLNKITDKNTVSFVMFGKENDIKKFYNYIYYSDDIVYLKRKFNKFKEYLSI